jgi:Tol biopolymer transport system component
VVVRDTGEGTVSLVSATATGNAANNRSYDPSMSLDGRYVAFVSMASDLVKDDGNTLPDVYLRDRKDDATVRVSAADGGDANGPSFAPAISARGTTVAFCSQASNLAAEDDDAVADAFVYDIKSGGITRVPPPDGATGEGCRRVALSADGNVVAFSYTAGSGAGVTQVFRRDMETGETARLTDGNGDSGADTLTMTDDGSTVFFESRASDLVSDDDNDSVDVFGWSAASFSLTRLSLGVDGREVDGDSGLLGLEASADGRYVVFSSAAATLVANDYNGATDIFRLDRETGELTLASATVIQRAPNGPSYSPAVSDDGRVVAFVSLATDVVYGDRNRQPDVFMRGGNFLVDAGLVTPSETSTPYDPSVVHRDDGDGIPSAVIIGALAAGVLAVLVGGWYLSGRKPEA